jgi:sugar phosphate isomerase/epimerase
MERSMVVAQRSGIAEPALHGGEGRVTGRLGITVPHEWWPSAPLLKSFEAAGFSWTQIDSPPVGVLTNHRAREAHALALVEALATTSLQTVVHAPAGLRLSARADELAFEGLLEYASAVGGRLVVYHALALVDEPGAEDELRREAEALRRLAVSAERLGVGIALENLAPLYPGPETISANPLSLRGLALRCNSDAVGICLDLGHAHIVAERRHTSLMALAEPVLDLVTIFHAHDNLGAREAESGLALGVDPLRLDLHLPPGRGTVPWRELAGDLHHHVAPVVLEVHPPYRPRAASLSRDTAELLG